MIGAIVEHVSENPTISPATRPSTPPITPGGLDPSDNVSTLGRMQNGSIVAKLVVCIEGVDIVLSDCDSTAAIQLAMKGTDWESADVLSGLFVELQNTQSITPDSPFSGSGRCMIKVLDTDGTDRFGVLVHKRTAGDKTTLTTTADRNDTTLNVAYGSDFPASGDAFLGVECFGYTGRDADSFNTVTRGKYSPFGCDSSGTGGARFPRYHRVSTDPTTTLSNPVVSEVPRNWIGKHVGVWLHTWSESAQALNTHAQAQLIFPGRIVGISDDPDTFCTTLEVEHISEVFKTGVVGRDLLAGEIAPGMQLIEGRTFSFFDWILTSTTATAKHATDLVVVASGASGAYEVNEGYYDGDELCSILSRWLAQAKADADIDGYYTAAYNVSSNVGPRSKIYWRIENANTYPVRWSLAMPGEVAAFLGFASNADDALSQTFKLWVDGDTSADSQIEQSDNAPYRTLVFKPFGPGTLGWGYLSQVIGYELQNLRGTFIDQYAWLPSSIRSRCPAIAGVKWGLFMLDERALIAAAYDEATFTITNAWLVPFQQAGDTASDALGYVGRRVDEPPAPVTIRQVVLMEGPFQSIVNQFVYSTGVEGLNHEIWDTLPAQLGMGIPGSLLGPEWDRSIANLPCANGSIAIWLDEAIKFSDLFYDDFRARRAFIRFRDQGFEFSTWRTPLVAISQHELTESNKAAPAGQEENHRVASQETDEWQYTVAKFDYSRDIGTTRNPTYLKTIQIEDQAGTDGGGASGRSLTLKMRNTFAQFATTGAAVEELIKEYIVGMPMFSRPSRRIVRSIDLRYFETISVGDICTIVDNFARDPLTGERGILSRAGIVTRMSYDLGGPSPNGTVRPLMGEIEIFFLDTQRGGTYSPGAEVDHEINLGGFSAGYRAADKTLRLRKNAYSFIQSIDTRRGPVSYVRERDASWFEGGYEIVVCERDPANPASPTTWTDTIASVSGDDLVLTTGLAGWDATKQYRVFFAPYADCTAGQQDYVFQADEADEKIVDTEQADQFSATNVETTFVATSTADKAEFVAELTYGDGKPLDVGSDAALGHTVNAFIDYASGHQQPILVKEGNGAQAGTVGAGGMDVVATTLFVIPIHFGFDHLTTSVTRDVTVALWYRASGLGTAEVRATLSRTLPTSKPCADGDFTAGYFGSPVYPAESSQSETWSTTSTTWQQTSDVTLSIAVKDLSWGMAYLIIEGSGDTQCRGVAKLVEGPRSQP